MSKPKKGKEKSDSKAESMMTGKKTLVLVIGLIVILAIVTVTYILLSPGTGSSVTGKPLVNGTGTGPAVVTGNTVSVYYTGMFTNGTVFDSNVNETPITFTVGSHQVIPGFEDALVGMMAGQTKTVNIPVDQAYGPYNPENIHVINRTGTLVTMNLTPGDVLTFRNPSTNAVSGVIILNVTPDTLTVDANNPLVGEPLIFTIQLVSINQDTG